ncbi:hypothetical protein LC612_35320, partial [Nostoc sp. CHAB 5834]|nr:hypothetical protein [Nostoc sp. CHAB 5834]
WVIFGSGFWGAVPVLVAGQLMAALVVYRLGLTDQPDEGLRSRLLVAAVAVALALVIYLVLMQCTLAMVTMRYLVWSTLCVIVGALFALIAAFIAVNDLR